MKSNLQKYGPMASLILALLAALTAGCIAILQREFSLAVQISLGVCVLGLLLSVIFNPQKARQFFMGRSVRYASNAILVVLATLGILIILNYITHRSDQRWDFTEDQTYSLSPETQNVLASLKEPVKATAFFTAQVNSTSAVRLLDTYKYYANGKFEYESVNPNTDVVRAQNANITRDGTIVFTYQGRSEQVTSFSEEEFTSALLRLTNPGERTVYFLTGHGEAGFSGDEENGISLLKTSLTSKNYSVETLNLLTDHKVPDNALSLIIVGPKVSLSNQEVEAIKNYLDAGGGLVYLSLPPFFTKLSSQANLLEKYIQEDWGMDFGSNMIVDPNVNPPSVTFSKSFGDHSITNKLSYSVFFPTAHSVSPSEKVPDNIYQTVLIQTSDNAWGETNLDNLDNGVSFDEKTDMKGPISVAIAATDQKSNAKIVVIGNANFAADQSFNSYGNSEFILNSIDWSAKQDNLLNLTPKNQTQRSLIPPQELTIGLIFLVVVIVIPGLVILMGVLTWAQRRNR